MAHAIRALRLRQGLSQRELAQRMNVPRTYVSKIENDKATPTIASLERLAGAMQTDVATILRSTGSGIPEDRVRELMSDTFISQLIPFVPKLAPGQMNHVLSELRIMASRFASGGRAVMGPR